MEAKIATLVANTPYRVEDLSRFAKLPGGRLVKLVRFSTQQNATTEFYANVDARSSKLRVDTLGISGLSVDTECMIPAFSSLQLYLLSSVNVTNHPVRYVIEVSKPNTLDKLLYGMSNQLTSKDEELIRKYKLTNLISTNQLIPRIKTPVERNVVAKRWNSANPIAAGSVTQIGETITVPPNRYGVLERIWVEGFDNIAATDITTNEIKVQRDDDVDYMSLNCFAMSPWIDETDINNPDGTSINLGTPLHVPFLDRLIITLENTNLINTDFRIGYVYSMYQLGIAEKIKWGLELTPEEDMVAVQTDAYDKVAAGLI